LREIELEYYMTSQELNEEEKVIEFDRKNR